MTTIDIMMPYYGDVSMMQAAVHSVLAQRDPRWRLTVVDDRAGAGADDGPGTDVSAWFAGLDDARVRYLRNERNLGVTGNFNKCLDLVDHDLAALMGCDDLMLPNYVGTMLAAHAAVPDAGIIQPGVTLINAAGKPVRTLVDEAKRRIYAPRISGRLVLHGERLAVSLLRGDWLYFPSLCWRSDALRAVRFRDDLRVIQDLALLIDLVQRGEHLLAIDTMCFQYRRHAASESSSTALAGIRFAEAERFFAEAAERMRANGWRRAARVAQRHLSSRLFAATLLPQALRARDRAAIVELGRHAVGASRQWRNTRDTPEARDIVVRR